MSTPELDRCPFCRGEAELVEDYPVDYWGECTQCKSHGAPSYNKRGAIAAWNRRAGPPAPAPEGWVTVPKRLLDEYRPTMGADVLQSWAQDVVAAAPVAPVAASGVAPKEAEPVAWMWDTPTNRGLTWTKCTPPEADEAVSVPLYAHPPAAPNGWQVVGFRYRFEPHLQWHLVEFENDIPDRAAWPNMDVQKVYAAAPTEGAR